MIVSFNPTASKETPQRVQGNAMPNLISFIYVFLLVIAFSIFVFPNTAQCEETSGQSPVAVDHASPSGSSNSDEATADKSNGKEDTKQNDRSRRGVKARENIPSGANGKLQAAPYAGSQERRIRSLEQGFDRSMRSINNSIRDANTSIQRIRTLERRF